MISILLSGRRFTDWALIELLTASPFVDVDCEDEYCDDYDDGGLSCHVY